MCTSPTQQVTPAAGTGDCTDKLVGAGFVSSPVLGDLIRTGVATLAACKAKCRANAACKAVSYSNQRSICQLSSEAAPTAVQTKGWHAHYKTYTICPQ